MRKAPVPDESWQMVEEAVFRLFEELAGKNAGEHLAIGGRLAELGWSEIEAEYPVQAGELLFRAQGRSLALTDCLDRIMLAELAGVLDGSAAHVLLPDLATGSVAGSDAERVSGIMLGPPEGRIVVPVVGPRNTVSVAVVDASRLNGQRLDTFDVSTHWTRVSGSIDTPLVEASTEWKNAVTAARRALAAKAAAGRAHRAVSDVALQVCGAIGLTAEHDLHRYVTRGFQIDALCGSHDQLEGLLAERLFEDSDEGWATGRALPAVVTWADETAE